MLLVGLVGTYLALVVLSYFIAALAVRPPRLTERRTPADRGLVGEAIEFDSLDGISLRGWWFPATNADSTLAPTVVLCHGFAMSHGMMLRYVPCLVAAGINALAFDFRRHGKSAGETVSFGFHEAADLLGAVGYARQRSSGRLGAFGVSMGGATVLRTAAVCEDIAAAASECAFARLTWAMASYLMTFLGPFGLVMWPTAFVFGQRLAGFRLTLCAPLDLVARISPRPLLLIHGTWDTIVWPFHGRALVEAAGEPKQLWCASRSWHCRAHRDHREQFERRFVEFFAQALREDSAKLD